MIVIYFIEDRINDTGKNIENCCEIARLLRKRKEEIEFTWWACRDSILSDNPCDDVHISMQVLPSRNTLYRMIMSASKNIHADWLIIYKHSADNILNKIENESFMNVMVIDNNYFTSLPEELFKMRILEEIHPSQSDKLKLRQTCENDIKTYFAWVNDAKVRQYSLDTKPIQWKQHKAWFENRLDDQKCLMFVMEADNLPVGQIRFENENGAARIDFSLDICVRGRMWAKKLVGDGITMARQYGIKNFLAEVKKQNVASAKTFQNVGFTEQNNNNSDIRLFQLFTNSNKILSY
jgi:L-amino acid N-acyltransferase YncA